MTDWHPTASLDILKLRARMLAHIREFFARRGVLEVETPCLSAAATPDPVLLSFATHYTGPGAPHGQALYLHTSPEFAMKRLLAAGLGSIYQICKVFRDGESGRLHNPEFTLLEWYRVGFDHHRLMDELAELVGEALGDLLSALPVEKLSYRDAFLHHCRLDPHTATVDEFAAHARELDIHAPATLGADDPDGWRHLLLSHAIEPHLGQGRLTFLYDYPASQAALARLRPGNPPLAERFELYLNGVELANGFHELGDVDEQRRRFEQDLKRREAMGLPPVPVDQRLLAAMGRDARVLQKTGCREQPLTQGLPDCAGVALGLDRLVMVAAGKHSLGEVLAFPFDRA